jgi:hypothetical protein
MRIPRADTLQSPPIYKQMQNPHMGLHVYFQKFERKIKQTLMEKG